MEDRVPKLLEKLLVKPSLVHPPPMGEGGLLLVSSVTGCICLYINCYLFDFNYLMLIFLSYLYVVSVPQNVSSEL